MSSYPPRRQIFPRRTDGAASASATDGGSSSRSRTSTAEENTPSASAIVVEVHPIAVAIPSSDTEEDDEHNDINTNINILAASLNISDHVDHDNINNVNDNCSVNSAGTDRASNHNTNRDRVTTTTTSTTVTSEHNTSNSNSNSYSNNQAAVSLNNTSQRGGGSGGGHHNINMQSSYIPYASTTSNAHSPTTLPVPKTVVAIDGVNVVDEEEEVTNVHVNNDVTTTGNPTGTGTGTGTGVINNDETTVKLTAEALAKFMAKTNNNQQFDGTTAGVGVVGSAGIGGVFEVSSNLSRSSSESGYLKNYMYNTNNKGGLGMSAAGGIGIDPTINAAANNNNNGNGNGNLRSSIASSSRGSGAATPAHFQPFGGEEVSSLGSLAEDAVLLPTTDRESEELLSTGGLNPSSLSMPKRELSEGALSVHPTLSAETPPKDNLSSSGHGSGSSNHYLNARVATTSMMTEPTSNTTSASANANATVFEELPPPIELAGANAIHTPPRLSLVETNASVDRLLPMGTGVGAVGGGGNKVTRVRVDSTIASIHPPAPVPRVVPPHSPYSPKPPSAVRVSNNIAYSPIHLPMGIHRPSSRGKSDDNGGSSNHPTTTSSTTTKKATFVVEPPLTRQSSNASSATNTTNTSRIRLGICAMDKKARSKPMSEILKRLDQSTFEPVFFGDDCILNESVDNWPICDVLIAFYSNGYPLEKAEQYVSLRQPYLLNDLKMQRTLMDRRRVYDLLEESGIDVPRHVFMSRDGYVSTGTGDGLKNDSDDEDNDVAMRSNYGCVEDETEIDEHDDYIEVNGVAINKPFVEKPVDADDHNIAIYYPSSAGGGCKKLFRKVGDRSSEFYPEINDIRRDGSYIYEEFIETQGTDVKMYTVGPDYGHAEARKSPTVDGKVERNADGKEVRFPVILTFREKEIARRIVLRFKQQVCGFDILRIQEGDSLVSYVCDVNGWSFVKNSRKYYDDCAQILTEHMLAALKPKSQVSLSTLAPLLASIEDPVEKPVKKKKNHPHNRGASIADRVKMMLMGENTAEEEDGVLDEENDKVSDLQGSEDVGGNGSGVGLGDTYEEPVDFTSVPIRNLPDQLANEPASSASIVPSGASSLADVDDMSLGKDSLQPTTHQEELRCVITIVRHGDRTPKQKLKGNMKGEHFLRYFHDHTKKVKKDLKIKAKKDMVQFLETVKRLISDMEAEGADKNRDALYKARHIRDILTRWKFSGLNRKLQMKPRSWNEEETPDGDTATKCSELQLIVKWGGDLTKLGEKQAVQLGNRLRDELYPSNKDGGILRLHSTFRHDLKIKTSDEGRVMKTAAAFAKGMLELEGDIPPILVSLVHKEKDSHHMLDPSGNKEVKKDLDKCKEMINLNMQKDIDYDQMTKEKREQLVGPERLASLHRALKEIGNPRKTLIAIHSTIGNLVEQLDDMLGELLSGDEEVIEGGEGLRGKEGHDDEALSGIKLYKGETLLELTQRWKLLQNKLYNEEKDTFDLSRVPDVHDNVRFDMLHNPHLGLTDTLQKLYDLAKSMADCVVPQEYGITIEEKRDIGSKMCHTLLEKINVDLEIARTDNQVDMRYLINMDYSADLPINSMGRRVRSRLYFTSESHLHSMLNVLRFPSIVPSPLNLNGQNILANASELCYLTQVVFRLFEDTQKPSEDPQRFRVEIFFSPGATATPLHMAELHREKDTSRFDTEQLQKISIDGLTCAQVEEYFTEAIKEGKTEDELEEEGKNDKPKKDKKGKDKGGKDKKGKDETAKASTAKKATAAKNKESGGEGTDVNDSKAPAEASASQKYEAVIDDSTTPDDDNDVSILGDNISNQLWRSAAAFGLILGVGCLFMMSRGAKSMMKSGR